MHQRIWPSFRFRNLATNLRNAVLQAAAAAATEVAKGFSTTIYCLLNSKEIKIRTRAKRCMVRAMHSLGNDPFFQELHICIRTTEHLTVCALCVCIPARVQRFLSNLHNRDYYRIHSLSSAQEHKLIASCWPNESLLWVCVCVTGVYRAFKLCNYH